ncbi:MAG TPA: ABC transporter substrate-binding protein [Bradyrhizobium sp.]|nr:ABC transporter substrate-binding protein [Bradyrhizobium sp.]
MQRRDFIRLAGGAATWPLAARAQRAAMPVVGFLNPTSSRLYEFNAAAFRKGLQDAGFVDGENVRIEYRWAEGDYNRLTALAAELVNLKVAVIGATGDVASARAAQAATSTIPIVFTIGADPVKLGLVASYNHPGGNLTGISAITSQIGTKRIEILYQLAPRSRVALLMNPNNPSAAMEQHDAEAAATALGQKSLALNVTGQDDFPAAFATFIREGADAMFVATDPMLLSQREAIAAFAAKQRVPAIHFERQYPLGGGLISYGTSISGMYRQAGVYSGQILKGASPAEMPVMQPTKFELVINLKTAKALGIEVSQNLLAIADEVIE